MDRIEIARSRFDGKYSCSESVFTAYAPNFGLDEAAALKIASGFGGGMGRRGLVCGAVTGAIMVLGLAGGRTQPDDKESKERIYALVNRFAERFLAENGSLACRDLTGIDISTPEGLARLLSDHRNHEKCGDLVSSACRILEEILEG